MSKATKWIGVAAVLVGAAIAVALLAQRHEAKPTYHGRTVEYWFEQFSKNYWDARTAGTNVPVDTEAMKALSELREVSVPYLVSWVVGPIRSATNNRSTNFVGHLNITNAVEAAGHALETIQPSAHLVIPGIDEFLRDPQSSNYWSAIWCLGNVGEGAEQCIPHLSNALTNSKVPPKIRPTAAYSLWKIGPASKGALPAVLEHLKDADTRLHVYWLLADLGPDAAPALPVLETRMKELATSDWRESMFAAEAVCAIDPAQAPEIVRLALRSSEPASNKKAALSFRSERGRDAIVPTLAELSKDCGDTTALDVLVSISPQTAVPMLRECMRSLKTQISLWAARSLARINSGDTEATEVLNNAVDICLQPAVSRADRLAALWDLSHHDDATAKITVATLLDVARNGADEERQRRAIDSLLYISRETGVTVLREKLAINEGSLPLWSAGYLLSLDPKDAEASIFLKRYLTTSHTGLRWDAYAVDMLANVSPDNDQVVDLLRIAAARGKDVHVRAAAQRALKKIQQRSEGVSR